MVIAIGQSADTRARAEKLYRHLVGQGRDVLFDDRFLRAGQQLVASETVGACRRWVVSDRLGADQVERESMSTQTKEILVLNDVL